MSDLVSGLNESQREAVLHDSGPLLVLAGAGSGKTRVLTHRIARLVKEKRCKPSQILAVTFTNKAAREMQQRMAELVSAKAAEAMTISTFHSFGVRILREFGSTIGLRKSFTIIGDNDRLSTIRAITRNTGRKSNKTSHENFLTRISLAKNAALDPEQVSQHEPDDPHLEKVYRVYRNMLLKRQSVDFDDLLLLPLRIFEQDSSVLDVCRRRYRYISIDEFQDTNAVQMRLARLLAAPGNNIMAVGDDDQGIYSWRGADIDNIIHFTGAFPGCRTVVLDRNYRSTTQILEGAHAVVSRNTKRKLKHIVAVAGPGEPIMHYRGDDETEEAEWIARTIKDNSERHEYPYSSQALLMRTNAMMRRFEEALRHEKIPYRVHGGTGFYDRKEIRDVLAYLQFFANPDDELSLLRVLKVPNRGITPSTIERLEKLAGGRRMSLWDAFRRYAEVDNLNERQKEAVGRFVEFQRRHSDSFEKGRLSVTLRQMLQECGYIEHLRRAYKEEDTAEARVENVEEIIHGLELHERRRKVENRSLAGYLQELSLTFNDDSKDRESRSSGVVIMTLHKSKGLEFPVVYLCGLDDAVMPSPRAVAEGNIAEERRLFYVGMTRAQKRLYLSWPHTKLYRKKQVVVTPCRFLREIPEEHLDGKLGVQAEAERQAFADDFFSQMRNRFGGS
jgi:superfamily I DNA/RNA helicase